VNSGVNGPYSNVGATTSVPAWPCASGANDVWFSCIALQNGTMSVDLCTLATWDTALQVFSGTCAASRASAAMTTVARRSHSSPTLP